MIRHIHELKEMIKSLQNVIAVLKILLNYLKIDYKDTTVMHLAIQLLIKKNATFVARKTSLV